MRSFLALGSLALLLAATGLGCEYYTVSPEEVRYSGSSQPDITAPQTSESESAAEEVIQPEAPEAEEENGGGSTLPETEAEPETEEDSLCPSGFEPQGTSTYCCRIDDPQVCIIVDPAPDGDGRPDLGGIRDEITDIKTDPTPPPPDDDPMPPPPPPGDGGNQDPVPPNCDGDSSDDARRRRPQDAAPGTVDEIEGVNDCVMF